MAIIPWPASIKTGPVDYGIEFDVQITAYRNGRVTTFSLPGSRWTASIRFETEYDVTRARKEALITKIKGGANRLSMHHHARPRPNGTLRGSPILGAPIVAGAETMTLANCNGGVLAGDMLGLPGQIVMVMEDTTPLFGNMTIAVSPTIRNPHNSGTAVVWNKPAALWIPRSALAGPFPYLAGGVRPAFSWDLVEAPE